MFNNDTTIGAGAAVPTSSATVPTTIFPGTTITSNSTFIIIGPPPPFPAPPRSIDFTPIKLIFAVVAIVAVPALVYTLFFTVPRSSRRRRNSSSSSRRRSSSSSDDTPHVTVDIMPPATAAVTPDSGGKLKKESEGKEVGSECSVCLVAFADGGEIRQLSACKHKFHVSCIERWIKDKDHPSCPICRADVPVKPTEPDANGNGNVNVNRGGGGNRRVSATSRDDDWRQGLPDASSLV